MALAKRIQFDRFATIAGVNTTATTAAANSSYFYCIHQRKEKHFSSYLRKETTQI